MSVASIDSQSLDSFIPIMKLTRKECFNAAHRLHDPTLSPDTNRKLFNKCNQLHGHNYVLEVTIRGTINNGMVWDTSKLKDVIHKQVIEVLDHRYLDVDIPFFAETGRLSSVENLAFFIWQLLIPYLPDPQMLFRVRLHETEKQYVDYYGEQIIKN